MQRKCPVPKSCRSASPNPRNTQTVSQGNAQRNSSQNITNRAEIANQKCVLRKNQTTQAGSSRPTSPCLKAKGEPIKRAVSPKPFVNQASASSRPSSPYLKVKEGPIKSEGSSKNVSGSPRSTSPNLKVKDGTIKRAGSPQLSRSTSPSVNSKDVITKLPEVQPKLTPQKISIRGAPWPKDLVIPDELNYGE